MQTNELHLSLGEGLSAPGAGAPSFAALVKGMGRTCDRERPVGVDHGPTCPSPTLASQEWGTRKRRPQGATLPRAGFTLIELVVSIGLLVLMMALAGQVFTLSIDSTGQATALIEVSQSLRMLENTLREDLAGINPYRSMLVIVANPIDAYWTAAQQEIDFDGNPANGYRHDLDPERDDLIGPDGIAINGDEGINNNPPPPYRLQNPRADILMFFTSRKVTSVIYPDISSNLAQVVYGHAELNELQSDGTWRDLWAPGRNQFPMPGAVPPNNVFDPPAETWHLARRSVVIVDAHEDTFTPVGDDIPPSPDEGPPGGGAYPLSDGMIDIIAQNETTNNRLFFEQAVINGPPTFAILTQWAKRSRMDLTPPPSAADRLGHYFLPKCASFKVEWGLSHSGVPGAVVWVDPSDIAGSVVAQFIASEVAPTDLVHAEFLGGGRFDPADTNAEVGTDWSVGTTHMFFARDFAGGNPDMSDPFFPKALRITVDVFDRAGKFTRPMRHVMVIPIGSDD